MHEIGRRYVLPPHDGFDLTVHLEADTACSPYDFANQFSKEDLRTWNLTWRFVGVMVEASQEGDTLGHAVAWVQPHGERGDGKLRDALGRSGVFSGASRERLVTRATIVAVDTVRRRTLADFSKDDDLADMFGTPTIHRSGNLGNPRYQWAVNWPDGQVTTHRSRTSAQEAVLITVEYLWTQSITD
ncbi:hypothetical protein [Rhodococcus sp. IEGM 1374]|uniref:hypothetical protein n=1 Tax=Rhodococcus sp. IEGM 1374 TaxID=3082221 RepID=UPI002952A3F3|nr:hypothetical protein [Rhodococcus sp. IEGM 1374]MDV7991932.1 hypothetical protein [Rhodococcus sp. IEGM 1374]